MSHITIIVNRAAPSGGAFAEEEGVTASVTYAVPHDASDQQVGQEIRRLYKQVKNLGGDEDE